MEEKMDAHVCCALRLSMLIKVGPLLNVTYKELRMLLNRKKLSTTGLPVNVFLKDLLFGESRTWARNSFRSRGKKGNALVMVRVKSINDIQPYLLVDSLRMFRIVF